jgi:dTDP-4-dehydrorhamnose reductase
MTRDAGLELWGGLECTVNRVGERTFDQVRRSGHQGRLEDLERFAALGLRTLRYPVLWERTAPEGLDRADWSWSDARLHRLRKLNVTPIVGLVHHGSGPRGSSLLEPRFAEGLAAFAGAVAARYPWVDAYTPVNEPLTTARFSCLYGHWYPHATDDLSFVRALLSECRATVLAMAAIRRVRPDAKLVQTEDLGRVHSTPALRYQADFENERRWLTFDLLCGRVDAHHPLWSYLRWLGVDEAELAWFAEHPCPPDVLGFNYYPTSERFLDERLARYPASGHGGNGRERYADLEAVRVLGAGLSGPYGLLGEAWARYGRPLAITEAHLGCTREEQLRWLVEVWNAARRLREEGGDVRAVTVWSLLGAYDWNALLTREGDFYEPGVFDVQAPTPRPTALAGAVRELVAGEEPTHPVLSGPGWWRRPERLLYPAYPEETAEAGLSDLEGARPLLIVSASALLGEAASSLCKTRGLAHHLVPLATERALPPFDTLRPWAVLYLPYAENVPDTAANTAASTAANTAANLAGVRAMPRLGDLCTARGVPLLTLSSSLVFDGGKGGPYVEHDPTAPACPLGAAFAAAETHLLTLPGALIVRTGPLFGPWNEGGTVPDGPSAHPAARVSPGYLPDVLNAALDLLIDGERGLWHLAPPERPLWSDLLGFLAPATLPAEPPWECQTHAPDSSLQSERGGPLPPLEDALRRWRLDHMSEAGEP